MRKPFAQLNPRPGSHLIEQPLRRRGNMGPMGGGGSAIGVGLTAADRYGIHFSDRFPLVRTPCGLERAPCAGQWRYVTCLACLSAVARDPRVQARMRLLQQEREQDSRG